MDRGRAERFVMLLSELMDLRVKREVAAQSNDHPTPQSYGEEASMKVQLIELLEDKSG